MFPVALLASAILFALIRATPGDPVLIQLGEQATAENYQALRKSLGLDKPMPVQYAYWLRDVATGNLGKSLRNGAPVREEIMDRLPATLELGAAALLLSLVVALPLGSLSAIFRRSPLGFFATAFTQVGVSLPNFVFAYILIYFFALKWQALPPGSYVRFTEDPFANLERLLLPAFTLSLFGAATLTRFVRSGLLDTLYQDYVRTARAKGVAERVIMTKHVLKNALMPVVTAWALDVANLFGGAVITESIFGWPGMGRLIVESVTFRDFPTVASAVFFITVVFVVLNLLVDLSYAWLDPRVKLA
jgi:peptide/nickel transport system permease protein